MKQGANRENEKVALSALKTNIRKYIIEILSTLLTRWSIYQNTFPFTSLSVPKMSSLFKGRKGNGIVLEIRSFKSFFFWGGGGGGGDVQTSSVIPVAGRCTSVIKFEHLRSELM